MLHIHCNIHLHLLLNSVHKYIDICDIGLLALKVGIGGQEGGLLYIHLHVLLNCVHEYTETFCFRLLGP